MFAVTFLVICISFVALLYAYYTRKVYKHWQSRNVPCREPKFPYGNLGDGTGTKSHVAHSIKSIYDEFKGRGLKFCGSYYWSTPILIILDLDLVKDILVKDFNNFEDKNVYHNKKDDPISANVSTMNGNEWKLMRTRLSPTFSSGKMKLMLPMIVQVAERLRDSLKEASKTGESLEMKDWLIRFSADAIGMCALGIDCNSLKDPHSEFSRMSRVITNHARLGTRFIALVNSFPNIARMLHYKAIPKEVSAFFMNAVEDAVKYRAEHNISRNDFMNILMQMRNLTSDDKMSLTEIAAQSFTFFAGFETTSNTLTHCLFELARSPDAQRKARIAIQTAFAKYDAN